MLFAVCGIATLTGAIYASYMVFDEFQQMLESHDAAWQEVGKAILTFAVLACSAITAIHSLAHIWL